MSVEVFAIVGAPLMLLTAAIFVVVVTGWTDRRDKERARQAER
jgi:hypothetical protein